MFMLSVFFMVMVISVPVVITTTFRVEAIFSAAVLALAIGGFCLGSFVYHLLRGHGRFARQTLPWAS